MTVLVVVGLMNLLWMSGMFVLFFAENHWKHSIALAKITGIAFMGLGFIVIVRPSVLALVSQ